jgi:hydrogenase expression/formation protein HypC
MTAMCLAIPGRILDVTGDDPLLRTGRVSFGGAVKEINLAYVPEACVGDYVIVHVGFAISLLDEIEAARVWAALDALAAASTASEDGDALPR